MIVFLRATTNPLPIFFFYFKAQKIKRKEQETPCFLSQFAQINNGNFYLQLLYECTCTKESKAFAKTRV
jgi:hypothetical protein